jgi:hypothetical protein
MSNPTTKDRIRAFLNPAIKGKFTNAFIEGLAAGDDINSANILAVKENLFIATASEQYLDKLAAGYGITRPLGTGMGDDEFRQLAIQLHSSQLVTNSFLNLLELFFGADAVQANMLSGAYEPYVLTDGMNLFVQSDDRNPPLEIIFRASDFANISQATAIEISAVISKTALLNGRAFVANEYVDASVSQAYVQLMSKTKGPASYISVVGGSAQNALLFPQQRPTTQTIGTQITSSLLGGRVRYTWTGGTDPGFQVLNEGDYVVIQAPPFSSVEAGTYTILKVESGPLGSSYFEIANPFLQTPAVVSFGTADDMKFYYPKRFSVNNLFRKASVYYVNPYEVVLYLPASTRIIRRTLIGSWHLHLTGTNTDFLSAYSFNPKGGQSISGASVILNQTFVKGQVYSIVPASTSLSGFPNQTGYLTLEFGTSNEEGPIRYFSKPSDSTLMLDPSYTFRKNHVNPEATLLGQIAPYKPAIDGSDYATYSTGTVQGRIAAESISRQIIASGIFLNIIIVYPNGPGLNNVVSVYAGDP